MLSSPFSCLHMFRINSLHDNLLSHVTRLRISIELNESPRVNQAFPVLYVAATMLSEEALYGINFFFMKLAAIVRLL